MLILITKKINLVYGCTNDVAVLNKLDVNGVSIFSFRKIAFANRLFTLMLVYKKQSIVMKEFSQLI